MAQQLTTTHNIFLLIGGNVVNVVSALGFCCENVVSQVLDFQRSGECCECCEYYSRPGKKGKSGVLTPRKFGISGSG